MLEVALFKEKNNVVAAIQSIPLSGRSNTRRTEILAADNKSTLLELMQKVPCYAIALDKSCDIVDYEQTSIFLRFFDIVTCIGLWSDVQARIAHNIAVKRNEFSTRFQDFGKAEKLSQFLKSPYEVGASAEWTDVAAKLFSPSLQIKIIDLQEGISLKMFKTASTEEFWGEHI
ncbi:unnamed protein product [Brassicogethes aeneus]|uniref:Uncharacterized protein n=1 Tax=Brassicogethes aeneus TaxID=1431903 RepID=A0A9P0FEC6_BRAAE|nr:unnamed protein product [Brassicogethes aeneus]